MRFIVDRWYVVPIVALVAMYVCAMIAMSGSQDKVQRFGRARVDRIYQLAQAGRYDVIDAEGLAPKSVSDYLRQQDRLFGSITTWEPAIDSQMLSNTYFGTVTVSRSRAKNTDRISGTLDQEASLQIETRTFAGDGNEWKITTPAEAIAAARVSIHTLEENKTVYGTAAKKIGDDWLITINIFGQQRQDYLVISNEGVPLQFDNDGTIEPNDYSYY